MVAFFRILSSKETPFGMLLALGRAHPYNPHTGNRLAAALSSPGGANFRSRLQGRQLRLHLQPVRARMSSLFSRESKEPH